MFIVTKPAGISRTRARKERRRLEAAVAHIPSLIALDLMLDADAKMQADSELRRRTRAMIIGLHPRLQAEADAQETSRPC